MSCLAGIVDSSGGETGIRTLDTLRYTRFPSVRLQPLGHLSAVFAGLFESNTIEPLPEVSPHFSGSLRRDILLNLAQDLGILTADANYLRTITKRLTLQVRANYTDPYKSFGNRSANFTARVGVTYRLGRAQ